MRHTFKFVLFLALLILAGVTLYHQKAAADCTVMVNGSCTNYVPCSAVCGPCEDEDGDPLEFGAAPQPMWTCDFRPQNGQQTCVVDDSQPLADCYQELECGADSGEECVSNPEVDVCAQTNLGKKFQGYPTKPSGGECTQP